MTTSTTYVPLVVAKEKPRDPYKPATPPPAVVEPFYFTFGRAHKNKWGVEMRDRYVLVEAMSRAQAIEAFTKIYLTGYMEYPYRWASCYSANEISNTDLRHFWPLGEYLRIHVDGSITTPF